MKRESGLLDEIFGVFVGGTLAIIAFESDLPFIGRLLIWVFASIIILYLVMFEKLYALSWQRRARHYFSLLVIIAGGSWMFSYIFGLFKKPDNINYSVFYNLCIGVIVWAILREIYLKVIPPESLENSYLSLHNSKIYHQKDCVKIKQSKLSELIFYPDRLSPEKLGKKPCQSCLKMPKVEK